MTLLPSVLIADIRNGKGEEIIKLLAKMDDVNSVEIQNDLYCYKWHIENKYYNADVNLYSSSLQTNFDEDIKNSIEAVIVFFDIEKENCIDDLDKWSNYLETFCISEKILLCKTCKGLNETKKDAVNDWCIKNEYELVELEPEIEDGCDTFPEAMGIDRVSEILQSHQWPNLIRKEKNVPETNLSNDKNLEDFIKTQVFENSNYASNQNRNDIPLDEEFDDIEQMATLFKNLLSMKSEISSLTKEQKLEQAEKVVKAFWNAVGGDADEFDDSDDNENICT